MCTHHLYMDNSEAMLLKERQFWRFPRLSTNGGKDYGQ